MSKMNPRQASALSLGVSLLAVLVACGVWMRYVEAHQLVPDDVLGAAAKPPSSISDSTSLQGSEPTSSAQTDSQCHEAQFLTFEEVYPTGELVGTEERLNYSGDSMTLIVPKLNLTCVVQNGTDEESLKKSPGLYEYAQMPSIKNANVSIAGHRDIYGSHFYSLDTLTNGDLIYLVYDKQIFQYEYMDTVILKPDNWDPIRCKEISCVTLTTCDPIGTSLNRMIVTGKLTAIYPYTEDFRF